MTTYVLLRIDCMKDCPRNAYDPSFCEDCNKYKASIIASSIELEMAQSLQFHHAVNRKERVRLLECTTIQDSRIVRHFDESTIVYDIRYDVIKLL